MEKLSPEDISRARKWRDGVKIWPLTADEFDYHLAVYSAAENERLTQALEQIEEFAATEAQSSRDLDAGDAKEWDFVVKMARGEQTNG